MGGYESLPKSDEKSSTLDSKAVVDNNGPIIELIQLPLF